MPNEKLATRMQPTLAELWLVPRSVKQLMVRAEPQKLPSPSLPSFSPTNR